eukprot:m.191321 g.191321  ORF g.191321 m.191321 type:complete len:182 (+) comp18589_c0_seq3:241-786(+)
MDPECSMDTAVTPANGPLVVAFADDLTPMPQPDVGLMPFVPDVVPPQPDQSHFVVHRVPFNKDNVIHFTLPPQYTDVVQISSGTYGMVARAIDRAHVNPETGEPLVVAIKKIRQPWGCNVGVYFYFSEALSTQNVFDDSMLLPHILLTTQMVLYISVTTCVASLVMSDVFLLVAHFSCIRT